MFPQVLIWVYSYGSLGGGQAGCRVILGKGIVGRGGEPRVTRPQPRNAGARVPGAHAHIEAHASLDRGSFLSVFPEVTCLIYK